MSHVHESPNVMLIPFYLLGIGAIFSGIAGYYLLGMVDANLEFWNGSIVEIVLANDQSVLEKAHNVPTTLN